MNQKGKFLTTIIALIAIIVATFIFTSIQENIRISGMPIEYKKALSYGELKEDDYKTQSDNVEFSVFFTKDLNNDGYAERVKGSTVFIGDETEELYAELKVSSGGYLENGKITLNSNNIYWNTAIINDNVVSGNYVGNTTAINLQEKVNSGSQKLFSGTISSKLGNNINDYSQINSMTLTGTYVDNEGNKTEINVTKDVTVDWYGNVSTTVDQTTQENKISYYNDSMQVRFIINTTELNKQLIIKDNIVTAEAPELNGYKATNVNVTGVSSSQYEFDKETGILTITKSTNVDENGKITSAIGRTNKYNVTFIYPIEARGKIDADVPESYTQVEIPVSSKYTAYNNQSDGFAKIVESVDSGKLALISAKDDDGSLLSAAGVGVGEYSNGRTVVSKQKATQAYNGIETKDDNYKVEWSTIRGELTNNIIFKQTKYDTALGKNTTYDLTDVVSYKGIYFENARNASNIKIYNDETNELIDEFEQVTNINAQNPYMYDEGVNKIRVEVGSLGAFSKLKIINIKQLDDKQLSEKFTKEQFNDMTGIYSYLSYSFKNESSEGYSEHAGYGEYNDEESNVTMEVSNKEIQTNELSTEQTITIKTSAYEYNQIGWKNGEFLVQFPQNVIYADISSVNANNSEIDILGYDLYKENGNYFAKIITSNNERTTYDIDIKCNVVINPTISTTSDKYVLYAYNQDCSAYYPNAKDIYDVNDNNNVEELVGVYYTYINIVAPSTLITSQKATNYDQEESVTVAPNIANVNKSTRTADINVDLFNNYEKTISEIKILGTIPFEGNTFIENDAGLGSQFSTTMTNTGIKIPDSLTGKVTIYYSENEKATKDLEDTQNGWTKQPQDFSKVKRYLIDFGENKISSGANYTFTYTAQIPEGIEYNQFSYSEHIVYFAIETNNGKLETQIEPNKLGLRIARTYNLNLNKVNSENNKNVPGAVFKLTELDDAENEISSKLVTTNSSGKIVVNGLFVNRKYTIEEIKNPNNYMLNNDKIKFIVTEGENGKLQIEVLSEDKFANTPSIEENTVIATIKDDPKFKLIINKKDEATKENLSNIAFYLKEENKISSTNEEGKAILTPLEQNKEYTMQEIKADGYYLLDDITFKLEKENSKFKITSENNNFKNAVIKVEPNEDLINVEVELQNDKMPSIVINKVDSKTKKPITGVRFMVKDREEIFTTDSEGKTTINGFEENKQYTIQEIKAEGYYLQNISFTVVRDENGKLKINSDNQNFANAVVIDETRKILSVTLDNEKIPSYKLKIVKTQEGTSKTLQGAKFRFISEDADTIKQYTTDENGIIEIPNLYAYVENKNLSGNYELQEIEAPAGYSNNAETIKFKVVKNAEGNLEVVINNQDQLKTLSKAEIIDGVLTLTIKDRPLYTIYKTDKETGKPLANVGFIIMKFGTPFEYAKDLNGNYIGIQNEEGQYIVKTNEEGKIALPLPNGTYVAIEKEVPEGYKNEEYVEVFEVKTGSTGNTPEEASNEANTINIEYIEDLLDFSNEVYSGNTYVDYTIKLINTLDFADNASYKNYEDTSYGDINEDGTVEGIKEELSKGKGFRPIGDNYAQSFEGTFDGNGKEIKNIYINRSYSVGLFGELSNGVTIKNLGLSGTIKAGEHDNLGGIVGELYGGTIINCYNNATLIGGERKGGIVGLCSEPVDDIGITIKNCYNKAELSGDGVVGGIIGTSFTTKKLNVINCYNEGKIIGTDRVGGIIGHVGTGNRSSFEYCELVNIDNCYNKGEIISESQSYMVGGLVGDLKAKKIVLSNSYNSGNIDVKSSPYLGGLVGSLTNCYDVNISNCYNEGTIKDEILTSRYNYPHVGGLIGYDEYYCNINIYNCNNSGDINVVTGNISSDVYTGGIIGKANREDIIYNCYNTGETLISGKTNASSGGISGYCGKINTCYNTGNIIANSSDEYIHVAGICGQDGYVTDCYNTGSMYAYSPTGVYVGGITGYGNSETNCYNTGSVMGICEGRYAYVGGISALSSGRVSTNCYNTGNITSASRGGSYAGGIQGYGGAKDCYNLGEITAKILEGGNPTAIYKSEIAGYQGYDVTNSYGKDNLDKIPSIKSEEYYNQLNVNNVWTRIDGYLPKLLINNAVMVDETQINVQNQVKVLNIKTQVDESDGTKGGTITGDGEDYLEQVKYGDSNKKEIEMQPNEGYEIEKITVNGLNIDFEEAEDGSYTIPTNYFENMQEDKIVVVKYAIKEQILTINKVDKDDNNKKLAGAKFNIEYLTNNIFGKIIANPIASYEQGFDKDGEIYTNLTTNPRSSYIEIDLTNKTGKYNVLVDAELNNAGQVMAKITDNTDYLTDASPYGKFIYINGNANRKIYSSEVLEGGKKYYLQLKFSGGSVKGLKFNNILLVENSSIEKFDNTNNGIMGKLTNNGSYYFEYQDGKLVPNNSNEETDLANSYIPIDLRNKTGKYAVVLKAESYSQLWATVTEDAEPITNTSTNTDNTFIFVNGGCSSFGITPDQTYTSNLLEGGKLYYLKIASGSRQANQISNINSVELVKFSTVEKFKDNNGDKVELTNLVTNQNGQIRVAVPSIGKYQITETQAPEGYSLNNTPIIVDVEDRQNNTVTIENKVKPKVIVHHYLKNENGEYTTIKVADDEETIHNMGDNYTVLPKMMLKDLDLEKDNDGNYVIPENAYGEVTKDVEEIKYYYETKPIELEVHHYVEGTEEKLAEDETINYNPTVNVVNNKVDSVEKEQNYKVSENENYETITTTKNYTSSSITQDGNMVKTEQINFNKNSTLNYYYTTAKANITVKYMDKISKQEIKESKTLTDSIGKTYSIDIEKIDGYKYVERDGDLTGKFEEDKTVILYYSKETKVIVNHIDKDKDKVLETKTYDGTVGEKFTATSKNFENYVLVEKPEKETIEMTEETITLNYYYTYIKTGVVEKHIDIVSEEILENEVHEGIIGDDYEIKSKEFEGYVLVEDKLPTNAKGKMTKEVIEVKYYYIKEVTITVKYLEKSTLKELSETENITKNMGEKYTIEIKDIEDYTFAESTEELEGTYDKDKEIILYYQKKEEEKEEPQETSVIEKHIDIYTNKTIETKTTKGKVGDEYEIKSKTFKGYVLVEDKLPTNAKGKMTEEPIEVIYYYTKKAKVTVRYVDKDTQKDIIEKVEFEGFEGDKYTAEEKEIDYYTLVSKPKETTGTMKAGNTEIVYSYQAKKFNLSVDKNISTIYVDGYKKPISNGKLAKIEVHRKSLSDTQITVEYSIVVKNTGEIAGSTTLTESVPEGFSIKKKDNKDWQIIGNTAEMKIEDLKPGEQKEYKVVIQWKKGEKNIGTKINNVVLVNETNDAKFKDVNSEDNKSQATLILTIATGEVDILQYVIASITLTILTATVTVLKKGR